jgi:hypothetical protein
VPLPKASGRGRGFESSRESEEEVLEKICNGLSDLDEGRSVSHERVALWLRDLTKGRVRRHPRPR